ncbi:hypothetical protein X801_10404 [Opisthorchis viverrini]|uniref:Uncharacterized protein n=1 Tax=Opisthorchis viverrini TaxID=6198 RepID=A0A1S8WHC2_OPIVI|nr:hypothetical protein X801_10404 [Opisthorchis viverrini]
MMKPLALFAASTENPFNENYFAIFELSKLPLATWDTDAAWKQIMYSTFNGGTHLRSIAVTVIHINATLPEGSTLAGKTYAEVASVLEGSRWTVVGRIGVQREAFHMDLNRVKREEISGMIYVTGINNPLRVSAKTRSEEVIEVRSFNLVSKLRHCDLFTLQVIWDILNFSTCFLFTPRNISEVTVMLFVPIGNQKLSAGDLPAVGSVEYNNVLEFASIYVTISGLREDLLGELGLDSSVLWAECDSLRAYGRFVIARGTAHFNTVRLTATHADLEREHLVESFNRKFKPTNLLILKGN